MSNKSERLNLRMTLEDRRRLKILSGWNETTESEVIRMLINVQYWRQMSYDN